MNRRACLRSLGAAGGAVLAGCLSSGAGSPDVSLARIVLKNHYVEPVEVVFEATKSGTQVHDKRHTLDAASLGVTDEEYDILGGELIVADWMGTPSEYELQFSAPAYDLEASYVASKRLEVMSFDELDCYHVALFLGRSETPLISDRPPNEMYTETNYFRDTSVDYAGDCTV